MSIDHEAAKTVCHARLAQDMHPSTSDRNIALTLIDLHEQLSAERARVDALAELVKDLARQQREDFHRMDYYEITVQELARIMEGRA
jgi:hypothetical protein